MTISKFDVPKGEYSTAGMQASHNVGRCITARASASPGSEALVIPPADTLTPTLEVYKLQSARFTNLNDTLYRVPPIFGTVIGGL